jgi:hypothetical protein
MRVKRARHEFVFCAALWGWTDMGEAPLQFL